MIQGKSNQDDQRELQDAIATSEHDISDIYRQSCTYPTASCVNQKWGFRLVVTLGKISANAVFFLARRALAQATCSEFGITVTFEEVQ